MPHEERSWSLTRESANSNTGRGKNGVGQGWRGAYGRCRAEADSGSIDNPHTRGDRPVYAHENYGCELQ
jgi:hypothetical protein